MPSRHSPEEEEGDKNTKMPIVKQRKFDMMVVRCDIKMSGIGVQINGMNAFWHSPPTEEGLYSIAIYLYPTKPTFDCQRQKPRNLRNPRQSAIQTNRRGSGIQINGMNHAEYLTRILPQAFPGRRGKHRKHGKGYISSVGG